MVETERRQNPQTVYPTNFDNSSVICGSLGPLLEIVVQFSQFEVDGRFVGIGAYQSTLQAFNSFPQPAS